MTQFSDLYDKFLEDVRNLQENCVHDGVSDWCTEMWGPGRVANRFKLCPQCLKVMEFKTGSGADLLEQRRVFRYPSIADDLRPKNDYQDDEGQPEKGDV